MKRFVLGLLIVISVLFIAGCASSEPVKESESTFILAVDDNGRPKPDWVSDIESEIREDSFPFYGYGFSVGTKEKTFETQIRKNAFDDAFNKMLEWLGGKADRVRKSYDDMAGVDDDVQLVNRIVEATVNKIKHDNSGFAEAKSWIKNDKTEGYILYRYPRSKIANSFKDTCNEFIRNESAAYAEFKSDLFFEELEKEFANY